MLSPTIPAWIATGVAHTPTDATTAMTPEAVTHRVVTLFYRGWRTATGYYKGHPGSQPCGRAGTASSATG